MFYHFSNAKLTVVRTGNTGVVIGLRFKPSFTLLSMTISQFLTRQDLRNAYLLHSFF